MADVPVTSSPPGTLARILGSDILYSFRRSKLTMLAAAVTLFYFLVALLAP